mmetsp:Transcript_15882/g.50595  ORF Transcript_15882/g.50595 Transcript_15882/m.50595 type:complete len:224 (-) Transcript_15882:812-1483(-)
MEHLLAGPGNNHGRCICLAGCTARGVASRSPCCHACRFERSSQRMFCPWCRLVVGLGPQGISHRARRGVLGRPSHPLHRHVRCAPRAPARRGVARLQPRCDEALLRSPPHPLRSANGFVGCCSGLGAAVVGVASVHPLLRQLRRLRRAGGHAQPLRAARALLLCRRLHSRRLLVERRDSPTRLGRHQSRRFVLLRCHGGRRRHTAASPPSDPFGVHPQLDRCT